MDDDNVIPFRSRLTTAERFVELCQDFPALQGAPVPFITGAGVEPWDVSRFMVWACSGLSHGEGCAARFVLSVWNPETDWVKQARLEGIALRRASSLKRFDVHEAMGVWDRKNRAAFLAWAKEPFWP